MIEHYFEKKYEIGELNIFGLTEFTICLSADCEKSKISQKGGAKMISN